MPTSFSTEEKIKREIQEENPNLSREQVDDIFDRLCKLADHFIDDWIKLKKIQ